MDAQSLNFTIFCIGSVADHLKMNARDVYHKLHNAGIISDYIVPCYDVLHTFSKEYMAHYKNKGRYYLFYLITLSGVLGVFLSGDFLTTFIFFELMSFSSYPLIIHDEKEESKKAGITYLSVAVISGMVLLMGLFVIYNQVSSLNFDSLRTFTEGGNISLPLFIGGTHLHIY